MPSQKLERKLYIDFEPKAITADAEHLNMPSTRWRKMKLSEQIRASSAYLAMPLANRSKTVDIYDLRKSSC